MTQIYTKVAFNYKLMCFHLSSLGNKGLYFFKYPMLHRVQEKNTRTCPPFSHSNNYESILHFTQIFSEGTFCATSPENCQTSASTLRENETQRAWLPQ